MKHLVFIPTGLNSPMLEILLSEAQKLINERNRLK